MINLTLGEILYISLLLLILVVFIAFMIYMALEPIDERSGNNMLRAKGMFYKELTGKSLPAMAKKNGTIQSNKRRD
jgi:hypothetical protein